MPVDFLIAGTQKGGTTALHSYLSEHPGLCLAGCKETHFFDTEPYFQTRNVDYARLHAHFRPLPGQLLGESTPITMYWADAPRRVWEYNPRMKLICILRNPIDRAFSHWNMEFQRGTDSMAFMDALRHEAERCRLALPGQHRIYSYADRGFYCEQIRRLWRFFPPRQTLFLKTEELRSQPQMTLDRVFDFLSVPRRAMTPRIVHALDYVTPMTASARQFLRDVFQWEIRALGQLLTWDCQDWLGPP
jgi:hypothetical protein